MKKFQNLPFVLTLLILASFSSIAFSQTAFPNSQIASWQMAYNSGNKSFSQTASPIWQIDSIGCFCGDCKNGIGTYIYSDGGWYKGEFKNGKMNGKGEFTLRTKGTYQGVFKNNKIIEFPSLINNGDHSDIYSETGHYKSVKFYLKYLNQRIDSSLNSKSNDSFDFYSINGCLCGNCSDDIGTYVYSNLGIYTGEWRDGMKNGKGTFTFKDGGIYDGEWKDGKYEGNGKFTFKDGGIYDGEWKNNKHEGNGKATFKDGGIYDGEWKNNKYEGNGKFTFKDGRIYDGEWKNDKYEGNGTMIWPNNGKGVGQTYKGEWKDGMKNGQGEINWTNGQKYIGGFKDGKYDGVGTMITQNGSKYVGDWKNDMRNGSGTQTFKNGEKYNGNFKNDKYSGEGTLAKPTGEVLSGVWKDGEYQSSTTSEDNLRPISVLTSEEQKCISYIDFCIKECNGELISKGNDRQIEGSFSGETFQIEMDHPNYFDDRRKQLFEVINIPWGRLFNTTTKPLTFEYSSITISFAEAYPMTFFNTDLGRVRYKYDGKSEFCIVVKAERIKSVIETIFRLNDLAEKRLPLSPTQLSKVHQWTKGILETYYVDNLGHKQGRYEGQDENGKLVYFGNYKDDSRIGEWTYYGNHGFYKYGHKFGHWTYTNGYNKDYDRDGNPTNGESEYTHDSSGDYVRHQGTY